MNCRTHRNRRVNGIDAEKRLRHFADLRQTLVQLLFSKMAQVEMNRLPLRSGDGAAVLLFVPERVAKPIPRACKYRRPSLLTMMPPSPRHASVISSPLPGRQVGWYWMNSISRSGTP